MVSPRPPLVLPPLPASLVSGKGAAFIPAVVELPGISQAPIAQPRLHMSADTDTVLVGSSKDFYGKFLNSRGLETPFTNLLILQVEISAPQLANTDTVTLVLYRDPLRTIPRDVVARFAGASQIAGMWKAVFSSQDIEYFSRASDDKLYGTVTNDSGNSQATTFDIIITAYKVE